MTINSTLYLVTSQSVTLSICSFLVLLVGLSGNLIVLYGSLHHKALKLDQVLLILIHNMAVADILYLLVYVFPSWITFSAGQWVLGDVWCHVQAEGVYLPGNVISIFTLAITFHRLLLFSFPTRTVTPRIAAFFSGAVWTTATVTVTAFLAYYGTEAKFDPHIGACVSSPEWNVKGAVGLVTTIMTIFVPLILITVINLIICIIAFKRSTKKRECMKGITLTCLISGAFIVSWAPYIAMCLADQTSVGQELMFFAFHCVSINTFTNPILYCLTNPRFRKFVSNGVREKIGLLCRLNFTSQESDAVNTETCGI